MNSVKVFILFGIVMSVVGIHTAFVVRVTKEAEATKHEQVIAKLETEKEQAKQDAKLAELAADEAVKRAQVAQGETENAKAKLEDERNKVHVEVIGGIEYLPATISQHQDLVIVSLETELKETKQALADTSRSLVGTKQALKLSENQLVEARLAMDAHKSALNASRWQGRIEGFGVGLLAGLVK